MKQRGTCAGLGPRELDSTRSPWEGSVWGDERLGSRCVKGRGHRT